MLNAPGARVAVLEPTPAGDATLRARATYDPATQNAVVFVENSVAPAGKSYELWAIRGAAPASLGVIQPDASGRAVIRLEKVGDPRSSTPSRCRSSRKAARQTPPRRAARS